MERERGFVILVSALYIRQNLMHRHCLPFKALVLFLICFLVGNKHEKCSPLISADPPEKVTKSNCLTSLIQ